MLSLLFSVVIFEPKFYYIFFSVVKTCKYFREIKFREAKIIYVCPEKTLTLCKNRKYDYLANYRKS